MKSSVGSVSQSVLRFCSISSSFGGVEEGVTNSSSSSSVSSPSILSSPLKNCEINKSVHYQRIYEFIIQNMKKLKKH